MVHLTRQLRFFNNSGFKKFYYGLQGFNKYGLYRDDFYNYMDPVEKEAVRRLPADLYDQLCFRIVRASQLEMTKRYLPESQHVSFEEAEEKGSYLQPYLARVRREQQEKEDWLKFLSKD